MIELCGRALHLCTAGHENICAARYGCSFALTVSDFLENSMKKTFLRGVYLAALAMAAFASTSFAAPPDPSWRSPQAQQQSLQLDMVQGSGYSVNAGSSGERTPTQVIRPSYPPAMMERMFWVVPQQLPTPWLKALAPPVDDQLQLTGITKMAPQAHGGGSGGILDPATTTAKNGGGSSCITANGGGSTWMSNSWRSPAFANT